jgi:hypothetical protein
VAWERKKLLRGAELAVEVKFWETFRTIRRKIFFFLLRLRRLESGALLAGGMGQLVPARTDEDVRCWIAGRASYERADARQARLLDDLRRIGP